MKKNKKQKHPQDEEEYEETGEDEEKFDGDEGW